MPLRRILYSLFGGTILLLGIIAFVIVSHPRFLDQVLPPESRYEFAQTNGDWEIRYRPGVRPVYVGSACIGNLKQLDGAKATWALENKKVNSDIPTPTDLFGITNYIRVPDLCPGGGTYRIGRVSVKPSCSLPGHTL